MNLIQRQRHIRGERELGRPLALFGGILIAYAASVAAIVVAADCWLLLLVPFASLLVVMLFVIGHDACHQSFTSSRRLNDAIGRIAFLPALHAYSLWEREHNRRHHAYNNIKGLDYAWVPLSPAEFAVARIFHRLRYRLYRDPGGVFLYYLFEIWAQRKIVPRKVHLGRIGQQHWQDTILLWGFAIAYAVLLGWLGALSGNGATRTIVAAMILPFLIFSALISVAIFLHHTHYRVPWYASIEEWRRGDGAVFGTVHTQFPWIFRNLILHIMEHNAHHSAPQTPLYRLEGLQERIAAPGMVAWRFSVPEYFRICGRCKLYDYDKRRWLDFKGRVTAEL